MGVFSGRTIFIRTRRVFEILSVLTFFTIIFLFSSRSATNHHSSVYTYDGKSARNRFLPDENPMDQLDHGRPDLAKYIHLDLKGAPPRAREFYEKFFKFLNQLNMGVKGVLIEYEDMLPFQGNLINTTHRQSYSRDDIQLILRSAKENQLEVIPLVQTFGHLEWILKLKEFQAYRDNIDSPMVISPCIEETYVLLEDLVKQTLDLHPESSMIHIGADEVQLSNKNEKCSSVKMGHAEQYVRHVQRIVTIVKKFRPTIRILIWDDILRNSQIITDETLLDRLKDHIEPVSWNYLPQFEPTYKSSPAWNVFSKKFKKIWAASAFKGGIHRYSMFTNTTHHVLNNRQWIYFIEKGNLPADLFNGIILTGWSRFDHFMPLCDLLPTAYPSLIYSLNVINTNKYFADSPTDDCSSIMQVVGKDPQLCAYIPALSLWSMIDTFKSYSRRIESRLTFFKTVAPEYNREHYFVRRHDLSSHLAELRQMKSEFLNRRKSLVDEMNIFYESDVTNEWIELYVKPLGKQIETILSQFSAVSEQKIWPRRPLH